jgi:hypothetical protein
MAKPRKLWSALTKGTQQRKLSFYRKRGLSDSSIRSRYNAGTLGPQSAARGHAATPERPERAAKNPGKYQKYIEKRRGTTEGIDYKPITARDRAYGNIDQKIGNYIKFSPQAVRKRVYQMMSDAEVAWTINASEDMIVGRAAANYGMRLFGDYRQSPWWYHKD